MILKLSIGLVALLAMLAGVFWIASTPDIPRTTLEAKYAMPPSQFISLPNGARAHIRDEGPRDAPALVLLHGSAGSLFTWNSWVQRLRPTIRVITVDLPDHGLTGAVPTGDYSIAGMEQFTVDVVDKLGIRRFAIGGHSMGGGIAARIAEDYPDRVTHLILVDASGLPAKPGRHTLAFTLFDFLSRIGWAEPVLLHITPRWLVAAGLKDGVFHKDVVSEQMIDMYWEFARMTGTRAATAARFRRGWTKWTNYIRDHIHRITAPTLVLSGEQDQIIPVETARAFANAIANAKLVTYPAIGHIPQIEVPDQSAADVRLFLTPHSDVARRD